MGRPKSTPKKTVSIKVEVSHYDEAKKYLYKAYANFKKKKK